APSGLTRRSVWGPHLAIASCRSRDWLVPPAQRRRARAASLCRTRHLQAARFWPYRQFLPVQARQGSRSLLGSRECLASQPTTAWQAGTAMTAILATLAWRASSDRSNWARTGPTPGPFCSFFGPCRSHNPCSILPFLEYFQGLAKPPRLIRARLPGPGWFGFLFFQPPEPGLFLACLDRQHPACAGPASIQSGWQPTNPAMLLVGFFSQITRKCLHMHVFLQEACRSKVPV
ncbi:MAG: hypothetical protein RJB47_569, partial [Pseudomonadota bacterium]